MLTSTIAAALAHGLGRISPWFHDEHPESEVGPVLRQRLCDRLAATADAGLLVAVVVLVFVNALAWHLLLALAFSHLAMQAAYARQRPAQPRRCASAWAHSV